jgi:apolipoprotein N-acyltransferase
LGFYLIKYLGTLTSGYVILLIFLLPTILLYRSKIIQYRKWILLFNLPFLFVLIVQITSTFYSKSNLTKELNIEVHQLLSSIKKNDKKMTMQNIINIINNSSSDYIVFAENNFPYIIDKKNSISFSKIIKGNKKVIIGATTLSKNNYYNSFLFFEKNNTYFFDKKILVPFGEFLPFRKYLKFMEIISGNTDFKEGNLERIIVTKDNIKILPIICYEIIFDKIFKKINEKEIDILINITNDSWFGNKIGPYQHFYISRIKSLIANKPLVRVSNNGISAIIDDSGKVIKFSKLNEVSKLNYKLKTQSNRSFLYFHKLFSSYLFIIFIIIIIFNRKIKNEK